jgi:predicted DNA-binding protein (UPF0251 family)
VARPQKCRNICSMPEHTRFYPENGINGNVVLTVDEYEVMRLLDYMGFSQEKCAERMNVSRTTVTRMYESVRKKIAEALVMGRGILIEGGDVMVCSGIKPECVNEPNCCHRLRIGQEVLFNAKGKSV